MERIILLTTNEGDLIVDPFMGSGTTAIACLNTNRNYLGFEIDKGYFEMANERIENHKATCNDSTRPKDEKKRNGGIAK